ncbi:hypothetical protein N7447_007508 [Penicillium robsamsonii]|uniref:uncharacterized protein n=1 Tax=Penicillium robsamsonii TaxID=1792511 RepID=UPI002547C78E|nr:uncharacterized protein N7447_007508 [Penicillium robsamsonii]KAJ5817500.1 hypothetical protein N7447_007508 [Penicillium robsamsonii]
MTKITSPTSPSDSKRTLHKATAKEIPAIKAMIDSAYSKYIERIGKQPAPMTQDWDEVILTHEVLILRDNERIVGSITFREDKQTNSLKIDNVVVDPKVQSRGYGSYMIQYAEMEGQKQGMSSVRLFTNVKMFENLGYYPKLGFTETERRVEDGFERVYFCKKLGE